MNPDVPLDVKFLTNGQVRPSVLPHQVHGQKIRRLTPLLSPGSSIPGTPSQQRAQRMICASYRRAKYGRVLRMPSVAFVSFAPAAKFISSFRSIYVRHSDRPS